MFFSPKPNLDVKFPPKAALVELEDSLIMVCQLCKSGTWVIVYLSFVGVGVGAIPNPQANTDVPSITISTTVPSPTAPLTSDLPDQVALPPKQAWCPSEIFCAGEVS